MGSWAILSRGLGSNRGLYNNINPSFRLILWPWRRLPNPTVDVVVVVVVVVVVEINKLRRGVDKQSDRVYEMIDDYYRRLRDQRRR